jgi:hypothetical protein
MRGQSRWAECAYLSNENQGGGACIKEALLHKG